MKKILSGILAAIFALAACETIQPEGIGGSSSAPETYLFTASIGDKTRTSLEYNGTGYNVVWNEEDEIIIWNSLAFCGGYLDDKYEICVLKAGAGTQNGEFLGSIKADSYVALYCNRNQYKYPSDGFPQIDLPLNQNSKTSSDGTLLDDINNYQYPMIAISDSRNLVFNNLCSILKIGITGNGEIVNSIAITSKNGEMLSGTAVIKSLDDYGLLEFSQGSNSLIYRCYQTLTSTPKVFNIVIPAQYYAEGLEIEVFTDCGSMTLSTDTDLTTYRSRYYDIDIDFQAEVMPDGIYLVSRKSASDLNPYTAKKYALVETLTGRYEKFLYMYPNDLYTLESWKDGKVTSYGAYNHTEWETDSGYGYRMSTIVPIEESLYYITLPSQSYSELIHVVLNMDSESSSSPYLALMPARWSLRGTFNAWGAKEMTSYIYDSTHVQYRLTSVVFNSDKPEFKFDHSGQWNVIFSDGYECLTNLGYGADELIFNGPNIPVPEKGVYDVSLFWQLTEGSVTGGFSYQLDKTGELPAFDYSKCRLELVGTSVAEGIPDISSWQWGNVLMAYGDGYPHYENGAFIWLWLNAYLYDSSEISGADPGFKIRSVGNEMIASVPYVDYGINGFGGANITVEESGYYFVVFYVDAITGEMWHEINPM